MSEFVFMLKMDGCGHCTATLQNAEQLKKSGKKARRFFHANTDEYHFLCNKYNLENELRTFLNNKASKAAVQSVSAFPTLLLVDSKTGRIVNTTVGAPQISELKALMGIN